MNFKAYSTVLVAFLIILVFILIALSADNEDQPIASKIRHKDGMKMVYIPAGKFIMGDETGDLDGTEDWLKIPPHEVYTDAFYIDEHEVTNQQYCQFLNSISIKDDGKNWLDSSDNKLIYHSWDWDYIEKSASRFKPKAGYNNHPVVSVYWEGADAYARWVGGRLPTEAEWEKAARGGLVGKKYPNGETISHDDANYRIRGGKDIWGLTAPVKSFDPNEYQLYDMAGNVQECCSDWWDEDYYSKSPQNNPTGPPSGRWHVVRGGSYWSISSFVRCAFRICFVVYDYNPSALSTVGFRVVVPSGGL
jgi:formylglycine-generating enzyme required for sulfatase activity